MCKYNEDIYKKDEMPINSSFKVSKSYKRSNIVDNKKYNDLATEPLPDSLIETDKKPDPTMLMDIEDINNILEGI